MCTGGQLKLEFPLFCFCDFFVWTNHECAAKRTGRTARCQPITSVQRSAQAKQRVVSQSRVCGDAHRQNNLFSLKLVTVSIILATRLHVIWSKLYLGASSSPHWKNFCMCVCAWCLASLLCVLDMSRLSRVTTHRGFYREMCNRRPKTFAP